MIKPVNAIQENCFAGTIGTDDGKNLTFFYLKTYTHQGLDASESHMDIIDFELDFIGDGHSGLLSRFG